MVNGSMLGFRLALVVNELIKLVKLSDNTVHVYNARTMQDELTLLIAPLLDYDDTDDLWAVYLDIIYDRLGQQLKLIGPWDELIQQQRPRFDPVWLRYRDRLDYIRKELIGMRDKIKPTVKW